MHIVILLKRIISILIGTLLFAIPAFANNNSPVGLWQIMDESTKEPASVIRIENINGNLTGTVAKLYDKQNAVCGKCSGDFHNKPILGLRILWGFTPNNDHWSNGKILAVKRGSIFDADLELQNQGQELIVSVKTPLGQKKQTWKRLETLES